MRRMTILLGAVAALMLVPAASAFANGVIKINLAGTGSGEVFSHSDALGAEGEGEPPIECSNIPGEEKTVCETELEGPESEQYLHILTNPGPESEFGSPIFSFQEGVDLYGICAEDEHEPEKQETINVFGGVLCVAGRESPGNVELTVSFDAAPPSKPLTLKINEGEGTVVSNPAGLECTGSSGAECTEEFEEGAEVTLTASPAAGYRFQSWQSCAGGLNGRQCTVTMSEAKEVGVKFKRVYDLTIVKAGSGLGSVYNNKNGLTCTLRCSSVTIPFPEGVSFTLSGQAPNAEFYFKEFTGGTGSAAACSGTECTMTLSEASTVEAVFEDRPTANLSIDKAGGGTAKIWGLLWCSENCTSTSGDFFSGQPSATEVTVHWDLADGTDSIAWSGASGSDTCTGTFTRTEANEGKGSCKVTTDAAKELTATLE